MPLFLPTANNTRPKCCAFYLNYQHLLALALPMRTAITEEKKKRKNPIQLIQRLEMPHSPGCYRMNFLQLSSNRKAAQEELEI